MANGNGGATSVDVEGMLKFQNKLSSALDVCNTAYTDMGEQQQMLAANWQGEAASAFGQALEQYLEDLAIVRNQLTSMAETMMANTHVYINTNGGSTALANAFKHGLPGLTGI